MTRRTRILLLGILAALSEAAWLEVWHHNSALAPLGGTSPMATLSWVLAAGLLYLTAFWVVWKPYAPGANAPTANPNRSPAAELWLIVVSAVLFRLTTLPISPALSPGLLRARWEGWIQSFYPPFNPYEFAPVNSIFRPIQSRFYAGVPHPVIAALHPPLTEWLYRWVFALSPHLLGEKLFYAAFDLLTIWTLMALLRQRGQPAARVLVYAWAPLSVLETTAGHAGVIAVFFLVLAFYLAGRQDRISGLALGLAIGLEGLPLLLLPAWMAKARKRRWIWLALPIVLGSLPYLIIQKRFFLLFWLRNLRAYAAGVYAGRASGMTLLTHALRFTGHAFPPALAMLAMAAVLTGVALQSRPGRPLAGDYPRQIYWILGALLLLAPRVTPAHVLWILPWLALEPVLAWVYFTLGVLLTYHLLAGTYLPLSASYNRLWLFCEYAPLYVLLAIMGMRKWRKRSQPLKPAAVHHG